MKKTIIVSALFAAMGTASAACSVEDRHAMSQEIKTLTQTLVAHDTAHLGKVMSVHQAAAVTEYHAGFSAPTCARHETTLEGLKALSQGLAGAQSAMLVTDTR